MNLRQALLRAVLAAVAAMLVFAGPSFGVRGSAPSSHGSLRDFSKATAPSKPTAAQRAAVKALHAKATWNSYGTAVDADASRRLPDEAGSRGHRAGRGPQLAGEAQGDLPARLECATCVSSRTRS